MKISHIHVGDKNNKGDLAIVLAVQEQLKKAFPRAIIKDFPIEVLKNHDLEVLRLINLSDLIVFGGGGVFYNYFTPFDLEQIKGLEKPLVIYGVGYIREEGAKDLNREQIKSIISLCQKAKLVGLRDLNTARFFKKHGLEKKLYLVGDPAIFLIEKEGKLKINKKKINIGLNLNYSGWLGFGHYKEKILSSYLALNNLNANFYYFLHHPGEKNIYKELSFPKGRFKIIDKNIRQQKYLYRQMDLIVGMMLHSAVLSFGAGTPFVNVAYDIRNKAFGEFISHPELVVSLNDLSPEYLESLARDVLKRKKEIKKSFLLKKNNLEEKQKKFLTLSKNLL